MLQILTDYRVCRRILSLSENWKIVWKHGQCYFAQYWSPCILATISHTLQLIIILVIMFVVLSSWQSHCESSPGSRRLSVDQGCGLGLDVSVLRRFRDVPTSRLSLGRLTSRSRPFMSRAQDQFSAKLWRLHKILCGLPQRWCVSGVIKSFKVIQGH